jgi:putative FmdB family regulatory protein
MPLYQYRCQECQQISEVIAPMEKSNASVQCPYCKAIATRIISPTPTVSRLNVRIGKKRRRIA